MQIETTHLNQIYVWQKHIFFMLTYHKHQQLQINDYWCTIKFNTSKENNDIYKFNVKLQGGANSLLLVCLYVVFFIILMKRFYTLLNWYIRYIMPSLSCQIDFEMSTESTNIQNCPENTHDYQPYLQHFIRKHHHSKLYHNECARKLLLTNLL